MSQTPKHCPRCFSEVSVDKFFEGLAVCECGELIQAQVRPSPGHSRTFVGLGFLLIIVLSLILHIENWSEDALKILPLKLSQVTGRATSQELLEIANICRKRKKLFCQEQALRSAVDTSPKETELKLRLANVQFELERYTEASNNYREYMKDPLAKHRETAIYSLALCWDNLGHRDKAKEALRKIVLKKQKKLNPQAARTYVQWLIEDKQYRLARKTLKYFRRHGHNASLFMEKEWKQLKKHVQFQQSA